MRHESAIILYVLLLHCWHLMSHLSCGFTSKSQNFQMTGYTCFLSSSTSASLISSSHSSPSSSRRFFSSFITWNSQSAIRPGNCTISSSVHTSNSAKQCMHLLFLMCCISTLCLPWLLMMMPNGAVNKFSGAKWQQNRPNVSHSEYQGGWSAKRSNWWYDLTASNGMLPFRLVDGRLWTYGAVRHCSVFECGWQLALRYTLRAMACQGDQSFATMPQFLQPPMHMFLGGW